MFLGETSRPVLNIKHKDENAFEHFENNFNSDNSKNNAILKNKKFQEIFDEKSDIFFCNSNNQINDNDCFMYNELCKNCQLLNQAYHKLKKNYLINSAGRVCTYRKGKMFCLGKFQRIYREEINESKKGNINFPDGARVLRAKIDMASPNIVMRDPTIYRIRHATHQRTGDKWCIYPMYDFAHCLSDSIEGITHSLCTLEFVNNRELYDWILDTLNVYHPQQIEFARLNLTYTILSKRKLIQLVREGHVTGWDDPRMPTLCGLRRKGVPPEALHDFCNRIGLARADSTVEYALLEFCIREYLNAHAPRLMAVLDPVKVVILNYPEDKTEYFDMPLYPDDDSFGSRKVPFSRELWIERDDYRENPPKKFHRLSPNAEVRLRYAYLMTCKEAVYDENGILKELHCVYDPESRGGQSPDGRKVKGTIHWVSAKDAVQAKVRLYEQLFAVPNPDNAPEGKTFIDNLNPNSLTEVTAMLEPALKDLENGTAVQFERVGYFCKDKESTSDTPIFNRTATLRDPWAKMEKR